MHFNSLEGNWKIKKYINKNTYSEGSLLIRKKNKNFKFIEKIKTNLNKKYITGFQVYKVSENRNNIFFHFSLGIDKNKIYQKFNKKNFKPSIYFCGKDLYISSLNVLSKNHFTIHTKINGPKKNYNIFSKYFRTI